MGLEQEIFRQLAFGFCNHLVNPSAKQNKMENQTTLYISTPFTFHIIWSRNSSRENERYYFCLIIFLTLWPALCQSVRNSKTEKSCYRFTDFPDGEECLNLSSALQVTSSLQNRWSLESLARLQHTIDPQSKSLNLVTQLHLSELEIMLQIVLHPSKMKPNWICQGTAARPLDLPSSWQRVSASYVALTGP